MNIVLQKKFTEVKIWTWLWLPATVFGNPIYNLIAYSLCESAGFSQPVSTNVNQIDGIFYIMILIGIFMVRYIVYRLLYLARLPYKMNTFYFMEVFFERHKFQVLSLLTFPMWMGEVEGNIAGFFYFPITLFFAMSVSIITMVRLWRMKKYLDKLNPKTESL